MKTKGNRDQKKQLVIIGGGGAGLAAAVAAAEKGATDILILEKRLAVGGISAMAVGPFAAESPAQKRQQIVARKDELFKIAMEWAHLKVNPRILRVYYDRSGETIRWLENKGLFFKVLPHGPFDHPLTMHVAPKMGADITRVLTEECKRLGVEIRTRTPAKNILLDKNGKVTGVVAYDGKEEFTIKTNSVIVCTGGYAGNKELMDKYGINTENMSIQGIPHTGDGLLMATQIGAAPDIGGILVGGPGPATKAKVQINTGTDTVEMRLGFFAHVSKGYMIWVNKFGRRFVGEAEQHGFESSNAARRQPNNLVFAIIDNNMVKLAGSEYNVMNPDAKTPPIAPGSVEKAVKQAVTNDDSDLSKMADSWEQIAQWIGCDPKVLQATIDEYNEACDCGHDAIFAKNREYLLPLRNPPFYAFRCICNIMNTLGGVRINEKMEVLNQEHLPIPGLYAAGNDAGSWTTDTYCTIQPGSAFGFALNSGRIAGEKAFEYANPQQ